MSSWLKSTTPPLQPICHRDCFHGIFGCCPRLKAPKCEVQRPERWRAEVLSSYMVVERSATGSGTDLVRFSQESGIYVFSVESTSLRLRSGGATGPERGGLPTQERTLFKTSAPQHSPPSSSAKSSLPQDPTTKPSNQPDQLYSFLSVS